MKTDLKIGIIQTCIADTVAWGSLTSGYPVQMSDIAQRKVWLDIRNGFNNFINHNGELPDIVILPELSIPQVYISRIKQLSYSLGKDMLIIGGLDFMCFENLYIMNLGIIIQPIHWDSNTNQNSYSAIRSPFGKYYFSREELNLFESIGKKPLPEPVSYILQTNSFGSIGLVICSDVYDIDRFAIYRGRIQHLLIIAYNQDKETFFHIANALSRILLCNIVICNSGFHGDSMAISPYKDSFKRVIYRLDGREVSNSQIVSLPVKSLFDAQEKENSLFKSIPPGFVRIDD